MSESESEHKYGIRMNEYKIRKKENQVLTG